MINRSILRRLLVGLTLALAGVAAPFATGALTPAMAQSQDDMVAALDAYGHWIQHAPYGEVWVPDGVPADWRPYEYGHWVYTDDWGWYWVSDESEDDWGWVVYHYGRWAFDRAVGWFWVPGDEWAPAWVDWRYGGDDIGWAPLPPDDLIDTYDAEPEYWVFVPLRYIGEPRLRSYYVPFDRRRALLRETHVINRPVHIQGQRIWVNPGLAPGFIAGRAHVTLHAYNVRPRVFGATSGVQGAVTVHRDDLRTKGAIKRIAPVTVQQTGTAIIPMVGAPGPKPLGKGERGQLGSRPPRAAQGMVTPQPGGGAPPSTGLTVVPRTGPAVTQPPPPKVTTPERREDRRVVTPPGGGAPAGTGGQPPKPAIVHPVTPPQQQPDVVPPAQPNAVRPASPPPPQVHAPPQPQVQQVRQPQQQQGGRGVVTKQPPKAGDKPPEQPR